jgi:hypothetical protein
LEPEGFAEFYAAYPRKQARLEAAKAWRKLAPDAALVVQIMAGLKRYRGAKAGQEAQFVKHPASWLNARRWEDDYPATVPISDAAKGPDPTLVKAAKWREEWERDQAGG